MPCSHGGGDEDPNRLSKRDFLKAAVAIGGASATAAASVHTDTTPRKPREYASDVFMRDADAQRQHAWEAFLSPPDSHATGKPEHHLMLHLDYANEGTPTDDERERVETVFKTFEEAYEWSRLGLIFTVSYSRNYFGRFDEDLPEGVDLWYPEDVIDEVDIAKDDVTADQDDVHIHLTSDHPKAVLNAEQVIRGNADTANGVEVPVNIGDVFEVADRRTGFVDQRVGGIRESDYGTSVPHFRFGKDVPGENPVPRDAPVFFGFKSIFEDSQPHEDHVTITDQENPFSGGTILQASILEDNVKGWYEDHDHDAQVERMFSPHHTSEDTGPHGRDLTPRSGTEEEPMVNLAARVEDDAKEDGVVGHAQKLARTRDPLPPMLRRDFPSTMENKPHTQFISVQRRSEDFVEVRKAMSFVDTEGDVDAADELPLTDHGILEYISVLNRGMYLMPPRRHRSLPTPRPE